MNNRGEINIVCCDLFFDGEDGQINQTILCHRRAQIVFNSFSFEKLRPPDATVSGSVSKILESRPTLWSRCQTMAGF